MVQTLTPFEQVGTQRAGRHAGGLQQKYVLDERGRNLILARYDGRPETITELARRLSLTQTPLPRWVVKKWGQQLGLARQKEPAWSPEEIDYLHTWLHRQSIAHIAHHLGRTQTAVKLKAKRLGLNKTSEGYTMRGLCIGLGCDHHKVARWLQLGWLKGTRRQTERQHDMWCFSDTAIRDLVKEHPAEIDPRRADWIWLVDVLTSK